MADPIPVLSLAGSRGADGRFTPGFLDGLRGPLHEVGFLQLTDFGAAPGQVQELTALCDRFFALPIEDRLALDNRHSPHFRGYTRLGHEITAGHPDAREQLDFAPEQPVRPPGSWDAPFRLLEGPNQWPSALPELRPAVLAWTDLLGRVGVELTRALAVSLGLAEDHFDALFAGDPHWFGKVIRYVGGTGDAQGVGPHADWGFLTLLLQDGTGGLQARLPRTREWVDVPPLPGALVVNVGEMLEVATHGYLAATVHRVLPCAPGATRQSVGFFWSPRLDAVLEPVPLTPELAARAPGVTETEQNALLPRFGDNALKGWLRSHPEVAARHHPDLVGAPER
ncbi:isopenicillin N synthase family dioxygenase [Pseudonocardia abyssalis]|uniref:Isopenicillin N synthase family oxygenase n=1 Tax=Pseudonocardia abyssalis TaxID=2792008 RepID=A0ABS6ULC0_9PSEU|nr:2-oxoglutarate and iron-dependent oxygenase domain-containing protein [Pseudonocardia abyssalis]MBW0115904.1 isopenicillin N synthase family oxygenase [Pseudonocardia abyssalis]MBW0133055.1 isopenicillin N synthase family oxygenase [Pseudonocardia abyssalis]